LGKLEFTSTVSKTLYRSIQTVPSGGAAMLDRRRFLTSGVALGGFTVFNKQLFAKIASAPRHLPTAALYDSDEDSYWAEIRKQFLIPEDEVFLNNGTVGSSPAPVLRAVFDAYNEIERMAPEDPEDYPLWGYGPRPFNQFRDPVAALLAVPARRSPYCAAPRRASTTSQTGLT
jgi:hypothetical protein